MSIHSVQHVLLHAQEATFGTPVAPTKDLGLRQNVSFAEEQNVREVHTTGQVGASAIIGGKADLKGSIELILQHGRPLEYIFGSVSHVETTGDWKHTFTNSDDLPSMTLEDSYELGATDVENTYNGVKLSTATIALALDGELSFRADATAKDVVESTSATADVISTITPLSDFNGYFKAGTLDSETALAEVQNMEITLNRNTTKRWGLGSREPTSIKGGLLNVDFKTTVCYQDNTEAARLIGGASISSTAPTGFGVVLSADNGTALGSGRREFLIRLEASQYSAHSKTTSLGDFVMADISGKGKVHECWMVDTISSANW